MEGGAARGRYSIIGMEPDLIWRCRDGRAEVNRHRWAILGVAIAVLILSLVLKSAYYKLVLTQVLLWAVL